MTKSDPLKRYKAKRNFNKTPEPEQGGLVNANKPSFVIQKHWASRLHYDFRLEMNGTMKSWAIPKGPSLDPSIKRMAIQVEDHPVSYNQFEGQIPAGQYGAGKVIIWDKGYWEPIGDPRKGHLSGKLEFELRGHKLHGRWALVRTAGKGEKQKQNTWLLIKKQDAYARPLSDISVVDELPDSVGGRQNHSPLPTALSPQLAMLVDTPPIDEDDWIFEIKFDGYRLLARVEGPSAQLYTRAGNDWSDSMGELRAALAAMTLSDGWYDGEIVVLDANGLPSFQALQSAFDHSERAQIVYFLFDLPFCDGMDLRNEPYGCVATNCAMPATSARDSLTRILRKSDANLTPYGLPAVLLWMTRAFIKMRTGCNHRIWQRSRLPNGHEMAIFDTPYFMACAGISP